MSQPLALVLVALIGALGGWVTNLLARRGQKEHDVTALIGTIKSSQAAAEENAFQRATEYYEKVIADQRKRLDAQDARIDELEGQVDTLTAELETAKHALRLKFPDE